MEEKLDERHPRGPLLGHSRAIARVLDQIRHLAAGRGTVLIEGEPGTGKNLVARAIHENSPRKAARFLRINLESLPPDLVESQLFGHEAVTEAIPARRGLFEKADGGTLFLDDVTEASPALQAKLVHFLQDRAIRRVGGHQGVRVDVRLLAATESNLEAEVEAGRFRQDLLQRLSAVRIAMPALSERRDDIPLLVEAFVREFNREHGRRVTGVTPGVLERFMRHAWPENVRELRNTLEGMIAFATGRRPLDLSDLPSALRDVETGGESLRLSVGMTVEEAERHLIEATLRHTANDKPRAAAMLGIGLRTLYRKIKDYGLGEPSKGKLKSPRGAGR